MAKQGEGAIINISSGTSWKRIAKVGAYSSTKRALDGLTLTAREELTAKNITVSLVYPGITATNFPHHKIRDKQLVQEGWAPANYAAGHSAESVAELIVTALREGGDEYFADPQPSWPSRQT